MTREEISRLIELLNIYRDGGYTFGELCELREFSYQFGDAIQESWNNDVFE